MSSLEQRLSRIEEKLKLENKDARRRIDLNFDISPQRPRPRPIIINQPQAAPTPVQLPLAGDGGSRLSSSATEIDQKLQEIMRQTGYLNIDGQQMRRTGNKDENKRILMDLDVVLKSHDCPYIVQCYGAIVTSTDVFIGMELMGTCAEKLKKRLQGPIPEHILGKMTVAIVKALLYLKEKHGVIHRDVKPSNILLDAKGQIKLCDFGISGRLVDSKAKTRSAGCAAYMARPKYHRLLEHGFIQRYEVLEVDVAGWLQSVMENTESPRNSSCYSLHQMHSPFSRDRTIYL
ncbi:hypothetical protein JZ751_013299 [Albula glossodonta]|uniref:mitogen-activated protein kinase kinase n=1 Tax=Albula glossodonta TaxID=121402 RepID=A0A8T2P2Q8_9TELE|nr:hypothetical protein JZ751_013299 [Albula glossodonta]